MKRPVAASDVAFQVGAIFRPDRVEAAALSPDGEQVAFAVHEGRGLELHVWPLDGGADPVHQHLDPRPEARLSFFAWTSAKRLVVVPNAPLVLAIDADDRHVTVLADEKSLAAAAGRRRPEGRPTLRVLARSADGARMTLEAAWSLAGDVRLDVVELDLGRGKVSLVLSKEIDAPGSAMLADRQGRPRLLFERGQRVRQYLYRGTNEAAGAWEPLDTVVGDGRTPRFETTPESFFGERSVPLGFGTDPGVLYVASNVGRDTFGIYALDLTSGRRGTLAITDSGADLISPEAELPEGALVFDRHRQELVGVRCAGITPGTHWLDDELAGVQAMLEAKFPDRFITLLEWDDTRRVFLALIQSGQDPGRYFVFHTEDGRCVEYLRQGALDAAESNPVEAVAFAEADGGRVTGSLTWPHGEKDAKPPLVVWLHDAPGQRASTFEREAQGWAAMGFAVLQLDYRGTSGFGRSHRDAVREGFDRVPIADVLAALQWISERRAFDRAQVAVVGEGFGGYLALRALELHPGMFHAAAAINAPLDLGRLYRSEMDGEAYRRRAEQRFMADAQTSHAFSGGENAGQGENASDNESRQPPLLQSAAPVAPLSSGSFVPVTPAERFARERDQFFFRPAAREHIAVDDDVKKLTAPVMLIHDPRNPLSPIQSVRRLRDELVHRGQIAEWVELTPAFSHGDPAARGELVREIGEFLHAHLGPTDANRAASEP